MTGTLEIRIAAVLLWTTAVGFGVFCIPAIVSLASGRGIPTVMGFPAYGGGPFERVGIASTPLLIGGFLAVCILEGVAGWLLWNGNRTGAILALALLPFGAAYWWGFALPVPPLLALVRTVLIGVGWRQLS
ncbi:MAG TPA: hypothetical protein VJU79_04660 [Candidatus Dormibacteraeota bacterium]|nr:hypothetical protein [Candidatus Dormibacteraeota bacterium]